VLVEALILDGDKCVLDVPRHDLERDARSELTTDLADERAVAAEDQRRLGRWHDLPRLDLGRLCLSANAHRILGRQYRRERQPGDEAGEDNFAANTGHAKSSTLGAKQRYN